MAHGEILKKLNLSARKYESLRIEIYDPDGHRRGMFSKVKWNIVECLK